MPYLPPALINQTQFPQPFGKDLQMAIKMAEESNNRFGTLIAYHSILKTTTPMVDFNTPVGLPPATMFDPLYGEAIPANMPAPIAQPHLSGTYQAANPELYGPAIPIRAAIYRGELDKQLKRYGFNKTRELLITFLSSVLDRSGITATEGDYIDWDGHHYQLKETGKDEYWKNTNVQLYVTCAFNAWRVGS
jgi:hypothetical protein